MRTAYISPTDVCIRGVTEFTPHFSPDQRNAEMNSETCHRVLPRRNEYRELLLVSVLTALLIITLF